MRIGGLLEIGVAPHRGRSGRIGLIAVLTLTLFFVSASSTWLAATAQTVMRIAAIVNDEVISFYDVESRVRLVTMSTGMPSDATAQRRMVNQVLRSLIDERLQTQEAERLGIRVTQQEVDRDLAEIADINQTTVERLETELSQFGVDMATLRSQIRASIAWRKIVQRQIGPQVNVGEDEVDRELDRLRGAAGQPQKRVYDIFLGVDSPGQDLEVRQNIERIAQQAREGSDFSALARSFSESTTARAGGDLGWVSVGQLQDELDRALASLQPGQISDPIRTVTGYHLLYVDDQMTGADPSNVRIDIAQLFIPLRPEDSEGVRRAAADRLSAVRPEATSCEALIALRERIDGATTAQARDVRVGDLPGVLQQALIAAASGEIAGPLVTERAAMLVGVCDRRETEVAMPDREDIMIRIGNERLDLLARRYMRDLRRDAFIDIRL